MPIAVLVTRAKILKQPKLVGEWIKRIWSAHAVGYSLSFKRAEISHLRHYE